MEAYLQFDGFGDDIYRILRGRELLAEKLAIVAKLNAAEIKMCLAVTVCRQNLKELPAILDFAVKTRHVSGVTFQRLTKVGAARNSSIPTVLQEDILLALAGGGLLGYKDMIPLPCPHENCTSLGFGSPSFFCRTSSASCTNERAAMFELIQRVAKQSVNAPFFVAGMFLIYLTGVVLLLAVVFKFAERATKPHHVVRAHDHPFSTRQMLTAVLLLFPFWVNSLGQLRMPPDLQCVYFGIGVALLLGATAWHVRAKIDIRAMWSDDIEIQKQHVPMTTGAYALARHPMYASLLLWCWGARLARFNWATLALTTFAFLPLMAARAKAEERELTAAQPEYRLYQNNVRMLTPTLSEA